MAKKPQQRPEEVEDDMSVDLSPGAQAFLAMNGDDDDDADDANDDDLEPEDLEDDSDDDDSDDDDFDDDDSDDDDSDDDDSDDEPKSKKDLTAVPKVKRKKKSSADERIAEVTAERRKAEEEAFAANLELQKMQERVAALEAKAGETAPAQVPAEPKASDFEYGEVDPKFIEAKIEHGVAVKTAKIQQDAQTSTDQAKAAELDQHYAKRIGTIMKEGDESKAHPNFTEVVNKATFDAHLARLVADSDKAVDIAYHLASNLPELLAITKMDPVSRAREIGKLEGKFSARSAARKRSKAPDPLRKKNRNKSKGDGGKYGPASQDDFDKAFFG